MATDINTDTNISGVIIQHEYGIFGGLEGEVLLSFMHDCKKPMLITLHTVLPKPSPKMKEVTAAIIHYATTIIVLTNSSKKLIETLYSESVGKVFMIPHGIHPVSFSTSKKYKARLQLQNHTILSTFGLLSRGKGIEYVLHALPEVIKKYPNVLYLILGETHPVVRRQEGEKYRVQLAKLIITLGLENHVRFYDQYFSLPDLFEFLKATDIYISTSTNPNQAVSGTLSYAMGSGRTVISTEFIQAKEIVTMDNGRLVPIQNSSAIKTALLDLLKDRKMLLRMNKNAYKSTRPMLWDNVAGEYVALLGRMAVPPLKIDHLQAMTDDFGLFQFASLTLPNKDFGYTLDDNARALIVCSWLLNHTYTKEVERLMKIYLAFIHVCQATNGAFTNYIGADKKPTLQNTKEDIEDSQTRALWALSEVMINTTLPAYIREEAKKLFISYYIQGQKLTHLRAKAFAIKSYTLVLPVLPKMQKQLLMHIKLYADDLLAAFKKNSINSWRWFERDLNYSNALLSESLLIAGAATKNTGYTKIGLHSLAFLIGKTFSKTYMPIGHMKWYKNNEKRSLYDQQPEDPASMILALSQAFLDTKDIQYKKLANICFSWFLGNNSLKKALYDFTDGGCYDGLHPDRVNLNQGAESLLSYMMASISISHLSQ